MTRLQQDIAAALKASTAQQERIRQQTEEATRQLCKLCFGAGFVRDTAGECRWACVCSAADNNKGETR